MPDRLRLVLADRPTGRPALVALAGAVEASALGARVDLVLARGAEAIAAAVEAARAPGQAALVAWSFFSADAAAAGAEIRAVRELPGAAGALHVAGGVHASAEPAATLALGFDLAARGEGEGTLLELAGRLLAGEDPRRGSGVCWLEGGAVRGAGRAPPVDLDAHPGFSRRLGKALALEITRGCVWACRFCQTPFQQRARWRHRGLAGVRAWARFAVELGHRDLRFVTPSALSYGAEGTEARLDAVEALLRAVREEVGPSRRIFLGSFPSELRPEHVSPEALAILRRWTDGRELLIGGQSGSDRLLGAMERGHGAEDIRRAVRLAREAGFDVAVDFIVGLPGEREEDLDASRRLMAELAGAGARIHGHAFMPLPGTPWKAEPAGRIDPETRRLLERLASQGRAYGQWKRQEELGAGLVELRKG
ncbi:MAG TPA: TIGR04013 family B12-binding domain/radical SAM domain-containing protein [Anaeromyxobacteraceae bacterium]|nr:TIGR04013 family B12-binding domain/radical SAM domain-containing protein [Anaeromyxobacteraceae bacterium]